MLSKKQKEWWSAFDFDDLAGGIVNLQTLNPSQFILDGSNNVSNWIDLFGNGNDFGQSTSIDRPDGSTISNGIIFDGGNEFLENSANIANIASNSQGLWFFVWDELAVNQFLMCVNDSGSNLNRLLFGANNDKAFIFFRDAGEVRRFESTNNLNAGFNIAALGSNGSEFKIWLNGVEETVVTVDLNDGAWFDSLTGLDFWAIAKQEAGSISFFNIATKAIVGYNIYPNDQQIVNTFRLLNSRYLVF